MEGCRSTVEKFCKRGKTEGLFKKSGDPYSAFENDVGKLDGLVVFSRKRLN